jgi:hypothetical protein
MKPATRRNPLLREQMPFHIRQRQWVIRTIAWGGTPEERAAIDLGHRVWARVWPTVHSHMRQDVGGMLRDGP